MKTVEKTALVAGGALATYFLARMLMNKAASRGDTQAPQPASVSLEDISSQVYWAASIGDTTKVGIGRQIVPRCVSYEEWAAVGSPVRADPYDVYATSAYAEGRPQGERNYWLVTDISGPVSGSSKFELDMHQPFNATDPQAEYRSLAHGVEEHLGRTGLTILVT